MRPVGDCRKRTPSGPKGVGGITGLEMFITDNTLLCRHAPPCDGALVWAADGLVHCDDAAARAAG